MLVQAMTWSMFKQWYTMVDDLELMRGQAEQLHREAQMLAESAFTMALVSMPGTADMYDRAHEVREKAWALEDKVRALEEKND